MEVTDADPKNKDKIKSKYVARTPVDLQRIKVEKLMEHPVNYQRLKDLSDKHS